MNNYVGHPLQIRGAETVTLSCGKGDGMKYIIVRNGLGIELWISLDRCADLTRVTFEGCNMGYFSPCGHVSSAYYDKDGSGFLKSFTAGFFTTAGLRAVGSPCKDNGEDLPLHGTIANTPVESYSIDESEDGITIKCTVRDCVIFGPKLVMTRKYAVSYTENKVSVTDTTINEGDIDSPYMILYHCNMGYPLLSENAEVVIPNYRCVPRNDHASIFLDSATKMEKPQCGYEECCYYYDVTADKNDVATVGIYNRDIGKGVSISYNKKELPYFTEWKMMGKKDYVLGLEPGNCTPDGRDVLRKEGKLQFIKEDQSISTSVTFSFHSDYNEFKGEF